MLAELFPQAHVRYLALPVLGPLLDGLACWLSEQGFAASAIRGRVRRAPVLDALLRRRGLSDLGKVCKPQLLELTTGKSQDDIRLSCLVRSLADFLEQHGRLAPVPLGPGERLASAYRKYLGQVRGLAASTQAEHGKLALDLLNFLDYDRDPTVLETLEGSRLEEFMRRVATTCGPAKLQNRASFARSFLRFLAARGAAPVGLDLWIDSPRAPRMQTLPRALPWDAVQEFLAGIDRDSDKGRRDYAMFLLMATYGLRTSEVAALRLDDIAWRAGTFCVQRPKVRAPLTLPLTDEAGAALVDYLQNSRPPSAHRTVFLRSRRPARPLSKGSIFGAFHSWQRGAKGDLAAVGPHSLRHSLAMHLLRQNTSVKTIGEVLGHRSLASTGAYLRLHDDQLRATSLDLPSGNEGRQ